MVKLKFFISAMIIAYLSSAAEAQIIHKPDQQLFYYGKLAIVTIDRQLYVSDTSNYFYIHVSIKNISGNALGLDLSNSWHVLYPNQWQFSDTTFRTEINERLIIPEEITVAKTADIAKKIKDNKLIMVLPAKTYDYYTEFNAEKPNDSEIAKNKYLIVAIDGQMIFTDGANIEQIKCNGDLNVDRELALKCPFAWQIISEKQKIRHRK